MFYFGFQLNYVIHVAVCVHHSNYVEKQNLIKFLLRFCYYYSLLIVSQILHSLSTFICYKKYKIGWL